MVVHATYTGELALLVKQQDFTTLTHFHAALDEHTGGLKVIVSHTVDDANGQPSKPIVSKEGAKGSFGFTTDVQGEYRFCFQSINAPSPRDQLEVDFELKVGYEVQCVFVFG
jgi:hypothetical protein